MDHAYSLLLPGENTAEDSETVVRPKKRKQGGEAKKQRDRKRDKCRVAIGVAFPRWKSLMKEKGLRSDAEVACFLLDSYEKGGPSTSTPMKRCGMPVVSSVSSIAEASDRDQELKELVGVEEIGESPESGESKAFLESMEKMSFNDTNMNEDEVNDLRNSVIDWEDPKMHGFGDADSSDEDYVPSFCIRTGGAMQRPQLIEDLDVIGCDETILDHVQFEDGSTDSAEEDLELPDCLRVVCEEDIVNQRACIAYEQCLKQLATVLASSLGKCTANDCQALPPFEVKISSKGTGMVIRWVCSSGHTIWIWHSQPSFKLGQSAGDFMMAVNTLLSGNNYYKLSLLFKFMNIGFVNADAFFKVQDAYCVDSIEAFWEEKRAEVINSLTGKEVVALADGRMDSPGHCAQYCTYSTMDHSSKQIICVINVDKRETQRNSVIMEKHAFITTMDLLLSESNLKEICTDGHLQIAALMNPVRGKYKDAGVTHSLDMWHGAKNLGKRIHAAGQQSGQSLLIQWEKDIVNHFWWCCKNARTYEQFIKLWTGILHHVVDEHEWAFGRCEHEDLPGDRTKLWMERGSKTHQALTDIVLNKKWLSGVHKYLTFRSTAELESFQNHIIMYAGKRFSFSPPVYKARTLLAALDYNFHRDRPAMENKDGENVYTRLYKKRTRRWTIHTVRTKKSYAYIPELQASIVRQRFRSAMPRTRSLRPSDPRRLGLLPEVPPPSTDSLKQTHVSRQLGSEK